MSELAHDSSSWASGISARAVLKLLSPGRFAAVVVLSLILLLLLAWARAGLWPSLALAPLIVGLAAIVVLDLTARIIPNVVTLPMLAYALLLAATDATIPLLPALLGAVIGAGLPLIVAIMRRGAIGGGDVKLMAMLGAALGWKDALYVFALAHVAGTLVLLTLFLVHRRFPRERFAIGAFISFVGAIFIVVGR